MCLRGALGVRCALGALEVQGGLLVFARRKGVGARICKGAVLVFVSSVLVLSACIDRADCLCVQGGNACIRKGVLVFARGWCLYLQGGGCL